MNKNRQTQLIIFAKYPEAGKVKTRLAPKLGFEASAKLAEKLLMHTLEQALGLIEVHKDIVVNLCVNPEPKSDDWQKFREKLEAEKPLAKHIMWTAQSAGDLGERLINASKFTIENNASPVFIGTDCPALTKAKLADAIKQLNKDDSVIVPANDGGYVLFGFNVFDENFFTDIAWSTEIVAQTTVQRINDLGWSVHQFEPENDIDYPEDLVHLPSYISIDVSV